MSLSDPHGTPPVSCLPPSTTARLQDCAAASPTSPTPNMVIVGPSTTGSTVLMPIPTAEMAKPRSPLVQFVLPGSAI